MKELLLGCGISRYKHLSAVKDFEWHNLTTVDINPNCGADVIHDLNDTPWPFDDDSFDEIHAYEVLEHLGRQGDFRSFFDHFYECWRILKLGGYLLASVPNNPKWIWGDPGHTRIIQPESLTFLNQQEYIRQVGITAMTDYRWYYSGNFEMYSEGFSDDQTYHFILKKLAKL